MFDRNKSDIFQQVIAKSLLGFAYCNLDGTLQFANDGFCKMLGISPTEIVQKNFLEFVDPRDQSCMKQMQALFRSGRSDSFKGDIHFCSSQGDAFISLEASLVRQGKSGSPNIITFLANDITGRTRNEELLRISERRL
ncbi:MAG: PAS domain-containing protein, partial [Bdellovibrionota bacterium]